MSQLQRLQRLQKTLHDASYDGLLIEDPISLQYLTGLHLSAGKLIITRDQARLLVDGRYIEAAQNQSLYPVILSENKAFEKAIAELNIRSLGFSAQDTPFKRYQELTKDQAFTLEPVENPINTLRMIKDSDELERLKEAAELGSRGFDLCCTLLEEGIREQDLAQELQLFWVRQGGKSVAFDPIIAFGTASSQPHYRAGPRRLTKGQTVLIDIGVTLNDYHSDMTRVVFFGEPPEEMLRIYDIVKKAQEAALSLCHPGMAIGALDAAARDLITKAGYGEHFTHSLGHGIGLEVHEIPAIRSTGPYSELILQAGMVITIEPGIYLPNLGGVRIEDTIVITNTGFENLTCRSKDVQIIDR